MITSDNRRALVTLSSSANGGVVITYAGYAGLTSQSLTGGIPPISRPILGGSLTGWHYQPIKSVDEVVAIAEQSGYRTTSIATGNPLIMIPLNDGESALWGPDKLRYIYCINGNLLFPNGFSQAKTNPTFNVSAAGAATFASLSFGTQSHDITGILIFTTNITGGPYASGGGGSLLSSWTCAGVGSTDFLVVRATVPSGVFLFSNYVSSNTVNLAYINFSGSSWSPSSLTIKLLAIQGS